MGTETYFAMAVFILGVFLAISYYYFRYIFRVQQQLVNQEKQIKLLTLIAQKQRATGVEINEAIAHL